MPPSVSAAVAAATVSEEGRRHLVSIVDEVLLEVEEGRETPRLLRRYWWCVQVWCVQGRHDRRVNERCSPCTDHVPTYLLY